MPWLVAGTTLVVLMGVENMRSIVGALVGAGRDRDTPLACVMDGGLPSQKVVLTTLAAVAQRRPAARAAFSCRDRHRCRRRLRCRVAGRAGRGCPGLPGCRLSVLFRGRGAVVMTVSVAGVIRVVVWSLRLADPVAEAGHLRTVDAGVAVHSDISTDGLDIALDDDVGAARRSPRSPRPHRS